MNDDLHPDAIDDELRRRFDAGAPSDGDPDAVLDAMRPRLQQARTRRRASFASAIAGVAVIAVVLAFVLGSGGGDGGSVRTPPAANAPHTSVPTVPTTGTTPTAPDSTPTTDAPPPISPAAPHDESFTSDGGSIVVRLADGQASLVSSSPAAGYTPEVHDEGPTRVEVRFSNGETEWRIRVDVANGVLQPAEITQH
jgi:hypothetical protein